MAAAGLLFTFAVAPALASEEDIAVPATTDPLTLVISLADQRMDVYRGQTLLNSSQVSTGREGHSTPAGVYTILEKRRHHRSNIYSRAPMPYMQRITWSGIALHEGRVPDYPASHGCIRLPSGYAGELFGITEPGAHVVISAEETTPISLRHGALFQPPSLVAAHPTVAEIEPHTATDASTGSDPSASPAVDFDAEIPAPGEHELRSTTPIRVLITRRTGRELVIDAQRLLAELGYDPGEIDGYMGPNTGRAILAFQRDRELQPTGAYSDELLANLYRFSGHGEVPSGHIYVRQDYVDIFDAPMALRNPEEQLGTHIYTAMDFVHDGSEVRWLAMTLQASPTSDLVGALDRVDVPADIRAYISDLLTPGSSLIISDAGLGRETGRGTDFIVQPQ
jgi:hypothetical protein